MSFAIRILYTGSRPEPFSDAINRYCVLLKPYAAVEIIQCKPVAHGKNKDSSAMAAQERILRSRFPDHAYPVALSEEGTPYTSASFARFIGERERMASPLFFIIGGSHGLSPGFKQQCSQIMSLSPLTFPHRLCLAILVEQIYRAFTILKRHPYHK